MNEERARELLRSDRARTHGLLKDARLRGSDDRRAAAEPGDMFDSAEPHVDEGLDDAIVAALERHLDAIGRAEQRLRAGTYGRSIRSGEVIPDARLEVEPTAELTIEESGESEDEVTGR